MGPISENPVLSKDAAAKLRFQEITPEVPAAPPEPEIPEDPEGSSEADELKVPPRPVGRHRRTPKAAIEAPPKEPRQPKPPPPPAPPKIKPPDFSEWHDFGANFAFKWLCRGYVGYVFRGIDKERVLNSAELRALEPNEEMLSSATKPFAHMADRSKFMKKHGRAIIDSADGLEALIAVGMYANTVRRIARIHENDRAPSTGKKTKNVRVKPESVRDEPSGQDVPEPAPFRVVNGESGFTNAGFGVGG
jgi:hypothetical protein